MCARFLVEDVENELLTDRIQTSPKDSKPRKRPARTETSTELSDEDEEEDELNGEDEEEEELSGEVGEDEGDDKNYEDDEDGRYGGDDGGNEEQDEDEQQLASSHNGQEEGFGIFGGDSGCNNKQDKDKKELTSSHDGEIAMIQPDERSSDDPGQQSIDLSPRIYTAWDWEGDIVATRTVTFTPRAKCVRTTPTTNCFLILTVSKGFERA